MVGEFKPHIGLYTASVELDLDPLFPCLSAPLRHAHSLSMKNQRLEKKKNQETKFDPIEPLLNQPLQYK